MARFLSVALAAVLFATAAQGQSTEEQARKDFRFQTKQSVYVVALETTSRDLSLTKVNLALERYAKEQFKKQKNFKIAPTVREADFIFFVLYDAESADVHELAIALLPSDYKKYKWDLDALRVAALWQGDEHLKSGRYAAATGATLGLSLLFYNPNIVKNLVKKFRREVFQKGKP